MLLDILCWVAWAIFCGVAWPTIVYVTISMGTMAYYRGRHMVLRQLEREALNGKQATEGT